MKGTIPKTLAVRRLIEESVPFDTVEYAYHGGGEVGLEAARALGVAPGLLFKSVVLEGSGGVIVAVVPSDRRVAVGKLMKAVGHRTRMAPVAPGRAETLTGYRVGGISPIGLKRTFTVCVHVSAFSAPVVYVNGGHRGWMISLSANALVSVTGAVVADIVEDVEDGAPSGGR